LEDLIELETRLNTVSRLSQVSPGAELKVDLHLAGVEVSPEAVVVDGGVEALL